jgi:hypothetical protein
VKDEYTLAAALMRFGRQDVPVAVIFGTGTEPSILLKTTAHMFQTDLHVVFVAAPKRKTASWYRKVLSAFQVDTTPTARAILKPNSSQPSVLPPPGARDATMTGSEVFAWLKKLSQANAKGKLAQLSGYKQAFALPDLTY